jgi:hypothetical protein
MRTLSKWLSRIILILPIVLFVQIGIPHLLHPVETLAGRGISFSSGFGITTARMGFGAFPLGLAVFLLGCVLSDRRVLTGLSLVATMDAVILVMRIFAMNADASVQDNLKLVAAEVVLLILTGIGILLEVRRRERIQESHDGPHREEEVRPARPMSTAQIAR